MSDEWTRTQELTRTGHLCVGTNGRIVEVSDQARDILGLPTGQVSTETVLERATPLERPVLQLLLTRGSPSAARMSAGERSARLDAQRLEDGRLLVAVRDITEDLKRRERLERLTEMMRMAESVAGLGHWQFLLGTNEVYWSDQIYVIHGMNPDTDPPDVETILTLYHPDDAKRLSSAIQEALEHGTSYELRLRLANEDDRWVHARGQVLLDSHRHVTGLFGTLEDVTDKVRRQRRLELISDVIENTSESVIVTDTRGQIEWANTAFTETTGYSLEEARGHKPGNLLQGPGTDPDAIAYMRDRLRQGKGFSVEVLNYHKNGTPYRIQLSVRPRFDENGALIGFLAVQMDTSELHRAQEQLEAERSKLQEAVFRLERQNAEQERLLAQNAKAQAELEHQIEARKELERELVRQARFDALTGIPNRRHLTDLLNTEVARARRYAHPLTVLMLDLDRFKRVNDTWGHFAGDAALQGVAEQVQRCLRATDSVGRTGGEEFVVLLPETDILGAQAVAERIRLSVEAAPVHWENEDISLTVSIGIAEFELDETVDALLARADAAMYRAKADGRNRWSVATSPLRARSA